MGKTAKNGRSNKRERYFPVPHYLMDTMAWRQLPVTARAAWLEFGFAYNGSNNGRLAMSARILGKKLGLSHPTAVRAIHDLITFGFLEKTRASSFSGKRRAAEYRLILTHLQDDVTGELSSRAFQNVGKIALQ